MNFQIDELKAPASKPWESLSEIEILKFANCNRLETNRSFRGQVERTYRKQHEQYLKAQAEMARKEKENEELELERQIYCQYEN